MMAMLAVAVVFVFVLVLPGFQGVAPPAMDHPTLAPSQTATETATVVPSATLRPITPEWKATITLVTDTPGPTAQIEQEATAIREPTSTIGPTVQIESAGPTATPRPQRPTETARGQPATAVAVGPVELPETGGRGWPVALLVQDVDGLGLIERLGDQLPAAVLLVIAGLVVARYAASLLDKLVDSNEKTQGELVQVIQNNTQAWGETSGALAKVGEGLTHLVALEMEQTDRMQSVNQEMADIRIILATKPCVAGDAVRNKDGK